MRLQAESLFSRVFHSSSMCICIATVPEGRIVAFNNSWVLLLGYPQDVLARSNIVDLKLWLDDAERERALSILLEVGRCEEWEAQMVRADGQVLDIMMTMEMMDLEVGRCVLTFARDVTTQRRIERELRESQERFRQSFEFAAIGKALVDLEGHWMEVNPTLCTLLGYSEEELLRLTFQDITHPDDLMADLAYVQQMLDGTIASYHMEKRYLHKQGFEVWVLLSVSAVHDAHGEMLYFISEIQGISERKRYEQQLAEQQQKLEEANLRLEESNAKLAYLATTDGLTGLNNRRAFDEHLIQEVSRASRHKAPLSLLMLDIDHFKLYNDTFGHPEGDEALRHVAQLILAHARSTDSAARYGGEEFAVLLPNTDREGALRLADRFRHALEAASWTHRVITASVGVSTLSTTPGSSAASRASALVEEADRALYQAKSQGRNRVVHAS